MFFGRSRATWIQLDPLTYSSVASLVSRTLRQSKDGVGLLSRLIHRVSAGNAFSVRNLLATLQRQHLVSSERIAAMALAELYETDNFRLGWQLLAVSFNHSFTDWLRTISIFFITDTISQKSRRYSYLRNLWWTQMISRI